MTAFYVLIAFAAGIGVGFVLAAALTPDDRDSDVYVLDRDYEIVTEPRKR